MTILKIHARGPNEIGICLGAMKLKIYARNGAEAKAFLSCTNAR